MCCVQKDRSKTICNAQDATTSNTSNMPEKPPFSNTGVDIDLAGPVYAKKDKDKDKVYIAHLKLLENMSPSTFLEAFRLFASRRGLPNKILTDNAKTFKSASKEVHEDD